MQDPQAILAKFVPARLGADLAKLSPGVRAALPHLKRALDGLHRVYLGQLDEGLPARYEDVMAGPPSAKRDFYEFFLGPWNPLEGDALVFPGEPEKRPGAALYPAGLSAAEFSRRAAAAEPALRESLMDHYSVVEEKDGALRATAYHEKYAELLAPIAAALRAAAAEARADGAAAAPLCGYLEERASSLLSGGYREADATWVRLRDTPLELVLGPYEVYLDGVAGVKAAYEGMLFAVDAEKGRSLRDIEKGLGELADAFPLPSGSRSAVGGLAPIVVVDLLYSSGEARQGVMAAAFNLPNDPWVRGNVGWKQVMIRNVMEAKFSKIGAPISRAILGDSAAGFEPFFYFVLLHEVSHGLGPAFRADGTAVDAALGARYTAIEEAKADTGALHLMLAKGGRAGVPAFGERELLDSYVAGLFRSMRFGLHEAHGAANLIEFNWLAEKGVLSWGADGRLASRPANLRSAAASLLEELCRLEAAASPAEAEAFIAKYAAVSPELEAAIAGLSSIPTDIRPVFEL
ncbi:MAG TPA: hypothetical protein PLG14_08250 [Spirochaetales bacterium]|nr:hypothetical protein [Spirochaetales bacterium]